MNVNTKDFSTQQFYSSLAENGFTVACVTRYIARKIQLSQNPNDENKPRNFDLELQVRKHVYQGIISDQVDSDAVFAINDMAAEISEVVDHQIKLFIENGINSFRTVVFEDAALYDIFATPYNHTFTMNAFNTLQKRVEHELSLREIYTQFITFDERSYLDFLVKEGVSLSSLEEKNESLIFNLCGNVV